MFAEGVLGVEGFCAVDHLTTDGDNRSQPLKMTVSGEGLLRFLVQDASAVRSMWRAHRGHTEGASRVDEGCGRGALLPHHPPPHALSPPSCPRHALPQVETQMFTLQPLDGTPVVESEMKEKAPGVWTCPAFVGVSPFPHRRRG